MNTHRIYRGAQALVISSLLMWASPLFAGDQDDLIEKAFKDSHIYRTELKSSDLDVDAENGVVVLKGKVDNEDQRRLAEDTLRSLPGVSRVDNRVRIANEPKEASDDWIALKVRGALLFHRNVSATDTTVKVNNGVVTLTGTAKSDAEKALASEYAQDVKGVKSVNNELQVVTELDAQRRAEQVRTDANRELNRNAADRRELNERVDRGTVSNSDIPENRRTMGDRIDDASITAQVKSALAVRKSTSALRTDVTTRDGIVHISGEAKNAAEKDLVSKIAENIDGVRSVKNDMNVANR